METMTKPTIPRGWRRLRLLEIIRCDDQIWTWGTGPWKFVGGSIVGTRYNRPTSENSSHWTIIRRKAKKGKKI
jgi:hypothetical protein